MIGLLIIAFVIGFVATAFTSSIPLYHAYAESVTQEASPIPPTFRDGSAVLAVKITTHEEYDGRHTLFQILMYNNETKEPIKYETFWLNITEITNSNEKVIFTELFRSETGKPINLDIVNNNDSKNASLRGATIDPFTSAIMPNNDTSITLMTPFISHTGNYRISFVVIGAEYPRPSLSDHPYKMNYYWDGQSNDIRHIKIVPEFGTLAAIITFIGITGVLVTTRIAKMR